MWFLRRAGLSSEPELGDVRQGIIQIDMTLVDVAPPGGVIGIADVLKRKKPGFVLIAVEVLPGGGVRWNS